MVRAVFWTAGVCALLATQRAHACEAAHATFVPEPGSTNVPSNQHVLVDTGPGCPATNGTVTAHVVHDGGEVPLEVTVRHWINAKGLDPADAHLIQVTGPGGQWPADSRIRLHVVVLPPTDPGRSVEFFTGGPGTPPPSPEISLDEGTRSAGCCDYTYSITGTSNAFAWEVLTPDGGTLAQRVTWPPPSEPVTSTVTFTTTAWGREGAGCFTARAVDPWRPAGPTSNVLCVGERQDAPPATYPSLRGCAQAGWTPAWLLLLIPLWRRRNGARR